jgi:hypothetical protein
MKYYATIFIVLLLNLSRLFAQNITYDMVKTTIDSVLNFEPQLNHGDYLAIDLSELSTLSMTDKDSILKYLHNFHKNIIETTFEELIKSDSSWNNGGYLNGFMISFIRTYTLANDENILVLVCSKIMSGDAAFDSNTSFRRVNNEWKFKDFVVTEMY